MTHVQDALTSRRTIYRYSNKQVDEKYLETGFEAARNAPCHKNTHPWRFYVLGRKARVKLVPEVKRLAKEKIPDGKDSDAGVSRAVEKILSPPELICVTSSVCPQDKFREEEDYAATVCAVHNLILSLWGNGIGSQWSTGSITRSDSAYRAIGASRENERIIGFIKIGYPEEVPTKNKKAIEEIRFFLP